MTTKIDNKAVEAAIKGGPKVDRSVRIAELEKQLEKVKKDIAEQNKLERHWMIIQSAYAKLEQELGKTLTPEEYDAVDGMYLFLHSGCVDMVRTIPSTTDKGEGKAFLKDVHTAEAMEELASLVKV